MLLDVVCSLKLKFMKSKRSELKNVYVIGGRMSCKESTETRKSSARSSVVESKQSGGFRHLADPESKRLKDERIVREKKEKDVRD